MSCCGDHSYRNCHGSGYETGTSRTWIESGIALSSQPPAVANAKETERRNAVGTYPNVGRIGSEAVGSGGFHDK